jgi:aminopeptidase-like protein
MSSCKDSPLEKGVPGDVLLNAEPPASAAIPAFDSNAIGREAYELISSLYPLCRSITGDGVRQTLNILEKHIPLTIHEVPTGTAAFDWVVPKEWNIRDAYIKNSKGERIVDFQESNLHVVSYSVPVKGMISFEELKQHLFTLPDYPDWIPYRTSYYRQNWGFCLSHNQFSELTDHDYEVCIDASLDEGYLTYGEFYLPGETSDEMLFSCHTCHPSLCNDNLSGVALATLVARHLSQLSLRYSYRFLFTPGTIGSITWLASNELHVSRIKHGLVLACLGDHGRSTYKRSRRGDAEIDRVVAQVFRDSGTEHEIIDFSPYGYDERQFCSPAFNLPVGCLMRTPHGQFPEYHTSADDLDFVHARPLADSFSKCLGVIEILEGNKTYLNQNPKCEPQLGRRGLYRMTGGDKRARANDLAMLWVLNFSDGRHSLLDIAEKSRLKFGLIKNAADALSECGLLQEGLD